MVNGVGAVLWSDAGMDQVNLPLPTSFTITSDGTAVTVGEVIGIGGSVFLLYSLSPAIKQDQTVTLTYTDPTSADDANALQDAFGNDAASFTLTLDNDSKLQTDISQSPATGAPTISGTAQVGKLLTANTSGIQDQNGLSDVSYSYQWITNDGNSDTDIEDATGSTYTPSDGCGQNHQGTGELPG